MTRNLQQQVAALNTELTQLKARLNRAIDGAGHLRLESADGTIVGVVTTHNHSGTGEGGSTLLPVFFRLPDIATDPAYVDGYAIIYFYSNGGVDELRVRGKIGAVETQVTLANLSP